MKNFVRGGVAGLLLSMLFVAIIYAQTTKTQPEAITVANDSQLTSETPVPDPIVINTGSSIIDSASPNTSDNTSDDKKKLVKKTASVKAAGAGASRGSFVATAYCLRGRTAMGHQVRRGIIAADPRVLRLGSTITISGGYAGKYLVSDTGGKIKGKRLDIWMPSCSEARRFGRRTVQVFQ